MKKGKAKVTLQKVWHFIWEDNSVWSWLVNILLAFILIKFIVYPGLGFLLQTTHPVVAVVSESMEHDPSGFDAWWGAQGAWYQRNDISKAVFSEFPLRNGFNKGDIMILTGSKPEKIEIGDVIVFRSSRQDPIIHRVVAVREVDGNYFYQTKGDNNRDSIRNSFLDETSVDEDTVIGKATVRVPFLGYIKIWFVALLQLIGLV